MKKFNEIIKEVNKTYQKIKAVEEKIKLQNTYLKERLYKKAYEKQQELDAICREYNSLAGNIKWVVYDD